MTHFGGGIGQRPGQFVEKRETEKTESSLVQTQAKMGMTAMILLLLDVIIGAIIIGEWLVVGTVLLFLGRWWLSVIIGDVYDYVPHTRHPQRDHTILIAFFTTLIVLVLWQGPALVSRVWFPIKFRYGYMYVGNLFRVVAPLWIRMILLLVVVSVGIFLYLLAFRMSVEISDPNWPPSYNQRDPVLGPWNPITNNRAAYEPLPPPKDEETMHRLRIEIPHEDTHGWAEYEFDFNLLRRVAKSMQGDVYNWSTRGLHSAADISMEQASEVLRELKHGGFIVYEYGDNDPRGGQLTEEGKALMQKLVNL